jgi:hypothetical protein
MKKSSRLSLETGWRPCLPDALLANFFHFCVRKKKILSTPTTHPPKRKRLPPTPPHSTPPDRTQPSRYYVCVCVCLSLCLGCRAAQHSTRALLSLPSARPFLHPQTCKCLCLSVVCVCALTPPPPSAHPRRANSKIVVYNKKEGE